MTELATTGISIWFFERANIPTAISSANSSIDTRSLGTPSGFWSSSGCSISSMFSAQSLIFDITLVSVLYSPLQVSSLSPSLPPSLSA